MENGSVAKAPTKGPTPAEPAASPVEFLSWACMFVALTATLYYLLHEPEDGVATMLNDTMRKARTVGFLAALLGGVPGVVAIVWRDGRRNLFAMAVLFNLIVASFWSLRLVMGA